MLSVNGPGWCNCKQHHCKLQWPPPNVYFVFFYIVYTNLSISSSRNKRNLVNFHIVSTDRTYGRVGGKSNWNQVHWAKPPHESKFKSKCLERTTRRKAKLIYLAKTHKKRHMYIMHTNTLKTHKIMRNFCTRAKSFRFGGVKKCHYCSWHTEQAGERVSGWLGGHWRREGFIKVCNLLD